MKPIFLTLAIIGVAQAVVSTCSEGIQAVITCHEQSSGITLPSTPFWTLDYSDPGRYPVAPSSTCCTQWQDLRAVCNVAEIFDALDSADWSNDDLRTFIAYGEGCKHSPRDTCRTNAIAAHGCVRDARDATSTVVPSDCCSVIQDQREVCVNWEIKYSDDTATPEGDREVRLPIIWDAEADDFLWRNDASSECGEYMFGMEACDAGRRAALRCARREHSNVNVGENWLPTTCCWLGNIANDFCSNEAPDDTFYVQQSSQDIQSTVSELFISCKDDDDNDMCDNTIPNVFMVNNQFVSPCDGAAGSGTIGSYQGVPLCPITLANAHGVSNCPVSITGPPMSV